MNGSCSIVWQEVSETKKALTAEALAAVRSISNTASI